MSRIAVGVKSKIILLHDGSDMAPTGHKIFDWFSEGFLESAKKTFLRQQRWR